MGLVDRFMTDSDEPSEGESEEYMMCDSDPDKGGWAHIDGSDDLDEPVDAEPFRVTHDDIKPGQYRLFAVEKRDDGRSLTRASPSHLSWSFAVESDDDDDDEPDTDPVQDEIRDLKRQIQRLEQQNQEEEEEEPPAYLEHPDKALKGAQTRLALAALDSPEFLERHGEKIALQAFGGLNDRGGGMSLDFETFEQHPIGAAMYQALDDPDTMGDLGGAFGEAAGKFMEGMSRNLDFGAATAEDSQEAPTEPPEQDEADEQDGDEWEPRDLSDDGPASMDSLGSDESGSLGEEAAEMGEALAEAEQQAERQRDSEAPSIETDHSEPMSAGPGDLDRDEPDSEDTADMETDADEPTDGDPEMVNGRPRCQATTASGDRCGNPVEEGSDYCHIPSHNADQEDSSEDTNPSPESPETTPTAAESSDPEAIAEEL
jgi:hypothetical protein